jgi:hypothetical protein
MRSRTLGEIAIATRNGRPVTDDERAYLNAVNTHDGSAPAQPRYRPDDPELLTPEELAALPTAALVEKVLGLREDVRDLAAERDAAAAEEREACARHLEEAAAKAGAGPEPNEMLAVFAGIIADTLRAMATQLRARGGR